MPFLDSHFVHFHYSGSAVNAACCVSDCLSFLSNRSSENIGRGIGDLGCLSLKTLLSIQFILS